MPKKTKAGKPDPRETLLNEVGILGRRFGAAVQKAVTSKEALELKKQAKRAAEAGAAAGADAAGKVAKNVQRGLSTLAAELAAMKERARKAK